MRQCIVAIAVIVSVIAGSRSTHTQDDVAVSGRHNGRVVTYLLDRTRLTYTTLIARGNWTSPAVLMDRDNESFLHGHVTPTGGTIYRTRNAQTTALVTGLPSVLSLDWGAGGDLLVSTGRGVLAVDPNWTSITTLFYGAAIVHGVWPIPPGEWILATASGVVRVNASGQVIQTYDSRAHTEVEVDPGRAWIWAWSPTAVRRFTYAGANAGGFPFASNGEGVLTRQQTMVIVRNTATGMCVFEIDPVTRATIRADTFPGLTNFAPEALVMRGSNRLHVDAPPSSRTITLDLSDPERANKPYVLALSLGTSPGINLGGRGHLALKSDLMLWLSITNPAALGLNNTMGYLDANGRARVFIRRPNWLPALPQPIYAAWVSYDNSGILSVSETEHFVLP